MKLHLMSKQNVWVKENQIEEGNFGLVEEDKLVADFGKDVMAVVLAKKYKVIDLTVNPPFTYVSKDQKECFDFLDIMVTIGKKSFQFGPEFLLWLHNEEKYVTWYFSDGKFMDQYEVEGIVNIHSALVESNNQKFYFPLVGNCRKDRGYNLPGDSIEQIHEFLMA